MKQMTEILDGCIIDNDTRLTLRQLCDACSVHAEFILDLVDEGVLEPVSTAHSHWCFSGASISRVRKARHLQRDLGLNLAGAALALELMDEIDRLHARLRRG